MNLKIQKLSGWILLLAGLAIILWTLYFSSNIFTAKTPPPEIFKITKKEAPLPKTKTFDLESKIQETIREELKTLIPAGALSTLLNLIAWSLFSGILILAGSQISSLGIKLLKK